tara:strand:- start:76 stop:285 length:210 start_codon:yes stop_codon:yes gene_type:complete
MNRQRLLQAETHLDNEIAQYEDELSYLRAAKKNIRFLIEKDPIKPVEALTPISFEDIGSKTFEPNNIEL